MTRRLGIIGGAALALSAAPSALSAPDPPHPPVRQHAEKGLADNVERVAAADPGLQSVADFLVTFVCAGEITAVARYQRNLAYVAILGAAMKSAPAAAAVVAGAAGAAPAAAS